MWVWALILAGFAFPCTAFIMPVRALLIWYVYSGINAAFPRTPTVVHARHRMPVLFLPWVFLGYERMQRLCVTWTAFSLLSADAAVVVPPLRQPFHACRTIFLVHDWYSDDIEDSDSAEHNDRLATW